ncbi:MAG TPA: GTPase ObgE [Candidatus Paceibacterota bacterium]|nr:GTPase ObgE [Candidatus Paceibacterota bacterium]HRY76834.1 GTPase ObgE [Candidatus Paceibacterota bacterium]
MLIDDVKIKVQAGHGGKGAVAFNSNLMSLGPTGARGGDGASVYVEGVADLSALNPFQRKRDIKAKDGDDGRSQFRDGHKADDLILPVPVGTVVHNLTIGQDLEILKIGQLELIAKGGIGGRGNFHFRSSTNTSPRKFEPGRPGEEFEFRLELKLIADVGLIGLPNVGKSSLLNELTSAKSKVANYRFTTLEPNLGAYYDLILADIPGLIEGASQGKGLGIKFLRHIEHTKVLFHLVAADSSDPVADYKVVRKELEAYNKMLLAKPEHLFISKSDEVSPDALKEIVKKMKKLNKNILAISVLDAESLTSVKKILNQLILEKTNGAGLESV